MVLEEIADEYGERRHQDIGNGRINIPDFDHHFQADIIDKEIDENYYEIAVQLHMSAQLGERKGDVFLQEKSRHKNNGKFNGKRGNVRSQHDKAEVKHLFLQNKLKDDEIQNPVENKIGSACYAIAEKLGRHVTAKRRVEKVDDFPDFFACCFEYFSHGCMDK